MQGQQAKHLFEFAVVLDFFLLFFDTHFYSTTQTLALVVIFFEPSDFLNLCSAFAKKQA